MKEWKLQKIYIGYNNQVLYFLITQRLKKQIKFVFYSEPLNIEKKFQLIYRNYENVWKYFNKY